MTHEKQMAQRISDAADEGGTIQAEQAQQIHGPAHPERHTSQSVWQAAEWLGCTAELEALGWERDDA